MKDKRLSQYVADILRLRTREARRLALMRVPFHLQLEVKREVERFWPQRKASGASK